MVSRVLIIVAVSLLSSCGNHEKAAPLEGASKGPNAVWVVDPEIPGPDQPPAGRSLFDALVSKEMEGRIVYDVPFPFERLTERIEAGFERGREPLLLKVLIPIGRSLQRSANRPDYFASPRVVAAVDRDARSLQGKGVLFAKDRLFMGYQAKSAVIEVISYNEEAGRFEFQIVSDYNEGKTPRVEYAQRQVCLACHQGHGPIFSRPLWDETNANVGVKAYLAPRGEAFFGATGDQGVDIPQLIDDATDRANLFAVYQLLWREGCASAECRADALTAALRYRLSGFQHAEGAAAQERERFAKTVAATWQEKWPGGLKIGNPDIPNRDPLDMVRRESTRKGMPDLMEKAGSAEFAEAVQATYENPVLEPRTRREPLEVWSVDNADGEFYRRLIGGLGSFFSDPDIQRIDESLVAKHAESQRHDYAADCDLNVAKEDGATILRFACRGEGIELTGWGGWRGGRIQEPEISRIEIAGRAALGYLKAKAGACEDFQGSGCVRLTPQARPTGLHARLSTGEAVDGMQLSWDGAGAPSGTFTGRARVMTSDDFSRVSRALAEMAEAGSDALSNKPLRRTTVLAELLKRL